MVILFNIIKKLKLRKVLVFFPPDIEIINNCFMLRLFFFRERNSFITEWALNQNMMHIPGNPLRDYKDKSKSHHFM